MTKFERYSKPGSAPPAYISIKPSTIKGSGMGVFANCDIPAGVTIGEYLGKIFEGDDIEKVTGDYLFSVSVDGKPDRIIDGKLKKYSSWVRYVNSPQSSRGGNAHFYQYGGRIFLKTDKVVPAGQEVFAYYGDEYINEKLRKYFSKENRPRISQVKKGIKC